MECLEIFEAFLYSYNDGRGGIPLVAIKGARLSALDETFPDNEDLSCDSYKYLLSNQALVYILKKPYL